MLVHTLAHTHIMKPRTLTSILKYVVTVVNQERLGSLFFVLV